MQFTHHAFLYFVCGSCAVLKGSDALKLTSPLSMVELFTCVFFHISSKGFTSLWTWCCLWLSAVSPSLEFRTDQLDCGGELLYSGFAKI